MPYKSQIDESEERMKRSCVEDIYSTRKVDICENFLDTTMKDESWA